MASLSKHQRELANKLAKSIVARDVDLAAAPEQNDMVAVRAARAAYTLTQAFLRLNSALAEGDAALRMLTSSKRPSSFSVASQASAPRA